MKQLQLWSIVTSVLCLIGCTGSVRQSYLLRRADVYALKWSTKTFVALTPDYLIHRPDVEQVSLLEEQELNRITEAISHRQNELNDSIAYIDARVVCLLHWKNMETDTLSFGQFYMQLNKDLYPLDTALLRLVAERLPNELRTETQSVIESYKQ